MAHVAQAQPEAGFNFDGLEIKLRSFVKTLFLKFVEARMESARHRLSGFRP